MVNLPQHVKKFIAALQKAGYQCYAVGGSVRDLILGRQSEESKRFDFATSATPEEIQKLFPESFYDNQFGTVGVKISPTEIFEVTPFRKEGKYSDARHPDKISWAKTIEEDLSRRDFTVNAMAVTIGKQENRKTGISLIDLYKGQEDLPHKLIRAVGDPNDRFSEDALRLLRAVRFATQLGFTIEEKTWTAITQNAQLITQISPERIRDELIKILSSDFPADGIRLLQNAGILQHLLPELPAGIGITQKGTHHRDDVFDHSVKTLECCQNKAWLVRLAALIHDIGKPVTHQVRGEKDTFYGHEVVGARIAKQVADRLHFSRVDREKLFTLVRWHMFSVSEFLTDAAVRRFIRRIGPENTADMLDIRIADRLGSGAKASSWRLEKFKERIIQVQKHTPSVTDLKVDGHDVMKTLKIGPGPKVGSILEKLFAEITTDPTKNEREYLLKRIGNLVDA